MLQDFPSSFAQKTLLTSEIPRPIPVDQYFPPQICLRSAHGVVASFPRLHTRHFYFPFVTQIFALPFSATNAPFSMKTPPSTNSITIGITDCARYANYERWFLDAPIPVNTLRLSYHLNNHDDLEKCQGLVLSGGEDVDPRRYKRPDLVGRLELTDIDLQRDEFEWEIITRALKLQLPILGICRGMQLFNVYQGGTLIFDIPTVTNIVGHAKIQGMDQRHEITVGEKTLLYQITGCTKGAVNSSHHQCVENLGTNLTIAARAEEPIVEAIHWQDTENKQFYLGVQWHPERMVDQTNPFAFNIRQAFLDYILEHTNNE